MVNLPKKINIYLSDKVVTDDGCKAGTIYISKVKDESIFNDLCRLTGDTPPCITTVIPGSGVVNNTGSFTKHTVDNNNFSFKVVTKLFNNRGINNEIIYCVISHPDIGSFVYEPKQEFYLPLLSNANFIDGECTDNDLSFVSTNNRLLLVSKNSQTYKNGCAKIIEKAKYTKNKTNKWKIGNIYGSYTHQGVYLGSAYKLLDVDVSIEDDAVEVTINKHINSGDNAILWDIDSLQKRFNINNIINTCEFFDYYNDKIKELEKENLIDSLTFNKKRKLSDDLLPYIGYDYVYSLYDNKITAKSMLGTFIKVEDEEEYIEQLGKLISKIREFTVNYANSNSNLYIMQQNLDRLLYTEKQTSLHELAESDRRSIAGVIRLFGLYELHNLHSSGFDDVTKIQYKTCDSDIQELIDTYLNEREEL